MADNGKCVVCRTELETKYRHEHTGQPWRAGSVNSIQVKTHRECPKCGLMYGLKEGKE